ncbi:hypothetical protein HETIRDRAFT_450666 [Heterobasidion irregulare TC 32-1]|uniref:Coiled-coil domain-containing protein 16 n=1 Tax=Heterobasidion irregulare (strain TC 32-1) TaxID=747525 RepID=W4KAT9_HETIT|nr:uncharacterized protein HETIRDRAFT_450666 [Heterobasidion irregulare TC 32-1]ETW82947.1 hypothetical protein HETIRDRAFT_450666 [Heterobasidion irregulare TC 32-1]
MSDARALLQARRKESAARVSHPYATYTAAGQLRCVVCGTAVRGAWEGHIGSKAHRVNAVRAREEAAKKRRMEEEEASAAKKRRVAEEREEEEEEEEGDEEEGGRQERREEEEEGGEEGAKPGGFPADFFSDPTRAPPVRDADEDEIMEDTQAAGGDSASAPPPPATTTPAEAGTALDAEWAAFERTVLAAPAAEVTDDDRRAAFARATVFAEPAPAAPNEGMPAQSGAADGTAAATAAASEAKEETQEERRQRIEREERELIMDRMVEEERAQEEADERVSALKGRLEMLKKRREATKAKKIDRTLVG